MKEKKINKNTIKKLLVDVLVDIIAGCLVGAGVYTFAANADLPLSDIVFVLVILLLSRLLVENKQLKDDNSMFI